MPDERRQFRILYRDFLFRMVDLEALTAHGDIQRLLGQLVAVLAGLSFTLAVGLVPARLSHRGLLNAAWGDEEFLIATTIAVVGIFAVIAWNTMLPDRRDSLVLSPLPVRMRTIFRAKISAIATALGLSVVAVNIFTGFGFALAVVPPEAGSLGWLRSLIAYWATMLGAGLFTFAALLAIQGVAAQLFSYRLFLRVSGFLQLAAFFAILSVYFLTPPLANANAIADPANHSLLAWLPSFWFLGLFQVLNGSQHPAFGWLARHAMQNLVICVAAAGTAYALAFYRHARRIIEQPDIAPADRSRAFQRVSRFVIAGICPKHLDRAILQFTARTIARSRQHRLLLAVYAGAGLAIGLAYAKSLWYGGSRVPWFQLNRPLLMGGVVLLFFAVRGTRAVFALPQTLRANWIFQITAVHSPGAYFAAVRRSLYILTAIPLWILSALAYFAIWPGRPALEHLAVLALAGVILVERSMYQFRKIPFACSYLPGGSSVNTKLGISAVVLLLGAELGTQIELWALQAFARFAVLAGILLAAAIWMRRRTTENQDFPIQFEEVPEAEIHALDLTADATWSQGERFVDSLDVPVNRPFPVRFRRIAAGLLAMLVCGVVYERAGEWRDHQLFARVGRSVDIGGRSLNIDCSGEDGQVVVLESAAGIPGLTWRVAQREIDKFARVCWYDRAGEGWSDPGPLPNTSESAARDLHKLLSAAGVPPPYVLVGHSQGALNVRMYNGLYPKEVAGMVLVDPTPEELLDRIPGAAIPDWLPRPTLLMAAATQVGLTRLFEPDPGAAPKGFTAREWATIANLQWQMPNPFGTSLRVSAQQVQAVLGLESLPLVVLSGNRDSSADVSWRELHTEIAQLSALGKLVVIPSSGAKIPFEAPAAVTDAVREVITGIRSGFSPAARVRTVAE